MPLDGCAGAGGGGKRMGVLPLRLDKRRGGGGACDSQYSRKDRCNLRSGTAGALVLWTRCASVSWALNAGQVESCIRRERFVHLQVLNIEGYSHFVLNAVCIYIYR